jgi:hypothetical protein
MTRLRTCPPKYAGQTTNKTGLQPDQRHSQQVHATSIPESLSPTNDSSNIPLPCTIPNLQVFGINDFPKRQTPFFNHQSCDILPCSVEIRPSANAFSSRTRHNSSRLSRPAFCRPTLNRYFGDFVCRRISAVPTSAHPDSLIGCLLISPYGIN